MLWDAPEPHLIAALVCIQPHLIEAVCSRDILLAMGFEAQRMLLDEKKKNDKAELFWPSENGKNIKEMIFDEK